MIDKVGIYIYIHTQAQFNKEILYFKSKNVLKYKQTYILIY